jgi:beta-phosphoglucomutase
MSSHPEALVFDFDGVIADTEPVYWRVWSELLAAHGIGLDWDHYCRIGRGIRDEKMLASIPELAARADLLALIHRQLPQRRERVRTLLAGEPPISAATFRLLNSLAGHKLGLVTSSEKFEVEPMLARAGILECFTACVFGDDTARHKPDPEPYLLIRAKLGIQQGGIAFEDSDAGLLSASRAGFKAICVATPADLPSLVAAQLNGRR